MKSALILVGTFMAMASAHATTMNLSCSSATVQLSGTLEVDASGKATGTLATTVTTADGTETSNTDFSGNYKVYPKGSFCYATTVTLLTVSGKTAGGTQLAVRSVRGADCAGGNGDTIYVSKDGSNAACTLTK